MLLYSSSNDADDNNKEKKKDDEEEAWKLDGAEYLVSRLRTFYEMGNNDKDNDDDKRGDGDDSFGRVHIIPVTSSDLKRKTWEVVQSFLQISTNATNNSLTKEEVLTTQNFLQRAFQSVGGEGQLLFDGGMQEW